MRTTNVTILPRLLTATILLLLAFSGTAGAKTNHALIVSVSDYPGLASKWSLAGPANDAQLLIDVLAASDTPLIPRANITLLANGRIEADGEPTRQNVLDALNALPDRVSTGDMVLIHFSGHGARQRARNPASEPDGKDEVFLPADTGTPVNGVYPNAIVDDDIGRALDGIRDAGAIVFVIFDSCFSGSATRSAADDPDVAERWLPDADASDSFPGDISLEELREEPLNEAETARPGDKDRGDLVAFFAAQNIEKTFELPLPPDDSSARRHGLFTYAFVQALVRDPNQSFRQLAQGIMHFYASQNRSYPTPIFEGPLDAAPFADSARPRVLQWQVNVSGNGILLNAGRLHGLERGAMLALLADPLDDDDQAIGYIRIERARALSSRANPVAHDGKPQMDLSRIPKGTYARAIELPLRFDLKVALPDPEATRFGAETNDIRAHLREIAEGNQLPLSMTLVQPGDAADLHLVVQSPAEFGLGGDAAQPRLWFLPSDGQVPEVGGQQVHSIGLADGLTDAALDQMHENLVAVYRANNLLRLAAHAQTAFPRLRAGFYLKRNGSDRLEPIDEVAVDIVSPGDEIDFGIENHANHPFDVDVLFIGPDYSIQHMLGHRFQSGERLETPLARIGTSPLGKRRILLIARRVSLSTNYEDLAFLEQIGLQTRSAPVSGTRAFSQLLFDIGAAAVSRGISTIRARRELEGRIDVYNIVSVASQ